MEGRFARLEPLDPAIHGDDLWAEAGRADADATWDYLGYGPFADRAAYDAHLAANAASPDPLFFAIIARDSGKAVGIGTLMRIDPGAYSIEIGHLWFSLALQRTPAATEVIFLLQRYAFELGYRRLEWKCNALNAPSRRAAKRFGFTFEGIFFRHMVSKGKNRDTAWYSILDDEWPAIRANFERWLAPENFDAEGRQVVSLASLNGVD